MAGPLACPHCQGPVAANPVGRWFQKFQCPHCKKPLQFTALTNYLGIAGWAFFVAMMAVPPTPWLAAALGGAWATMLFLSWRLRGIAKA